MLRTPHVSISPSTPGVILVINKIVFIAARLLVLLFAALAFVVVAALAAVQFQPVRGWGVRNALSLVNESLEGKIVVGEITGNLISGATLHNVRLLAAGDTLVQARRVQLRYQLSPFFRSKIIGARIMIDAPDIRLIRSAADSTWNFEHIVRPSTTVDTTSSGPFPYTIEVSSLELRGGHFEMRDMTQPAGRDTAAFDPARISVRELYLSAEARMADQSYALRLHNLAGYLERPSIHLIQLAGDFSLDTLGARAERLRIETDRTLLDLTARADRVNILGKEPVDWGRVPLSLALDARSVGVADLQRFVPSLDFIAGAPAVRLQAHGNLADLSIDTLDLAIRRTNVHMRGRLRNLDESSALLMEGAIANSLIDPEEIRATLPGIALGNLPATGDVRLNAASFAGTPERFNAALDAVTDAGAARGGVMLDLSGPVERYEADLAVARLDLGTLLRDRSLAGNINGRLLATGAGFTPSSISTRFLLDARESRMMDRNVRRLVARGVYSEGGVIRLDTLLLAPGGRGLGTGEDLLDETPTSIDAFVRSSGARARMDIALPQISAPVVGISGMLDIRRTDDLVYDLRGRAVDLSVADLSPGGSSDRFSATFAVDGHGIDPDRLEARARVEVQQSDIADIEKLSGRRIDVVLENDGAGGRNFEVKSQGFVDASVRGRWTLDGLMAAGNVGIQELINDILRAAGQSTAPHQHQAIRIAPMAASYSVRIDDLSPVQPFLSGIKLAGAVNLAGTVASPDGSSIAVTAAGSFSRVMFLQRSGNDTATYLRVDTLDLLQVAASSGAVGVGEPTVKLVVKSDTTIYYNDLSIEKPTLSAELENRLLHVRGSTGINKQIGVLLDGNIGLDNPQGFDVALDTLTVLLPNNNRISSIGPLRALVHPDRIRIDTLALQFNDVGVVRARGSLLNNDTFDSIVVSVSTEGKPLQYDDAVALLQTAEVRVSGTMESPVIDLDLALDSVYYRQVPVGHLRSKIHYADRNATGQVLVLPVDRAVSDSARPLARVQINTVPVDLAFASREERILGDKPFDVQINTDGLPATIAGPFVPQAEVLGGTVTTMFKVGGNYPQLRFNGQAQLSGVAFRLQANNLIYSANGTVRFTDTALSVKLDLRNDPRDLPNGLAKITARLWMNDFTPGKYTVKVESDQIMLLNDASQAAGIGLYGDLIIGTDLLEAEGEIKDPVTALITGNLKIIGANLKYDQSAGQTTVTSTTHVDMAEWNRRYTDVYGPDFGSDDDSTAVVKDSTRRDTLSSPARGSLAEREQVLRYLQQRDTTAADTSSRSNRGPRDMNDGLEIRDLGITIEGTTTFTITFGVLQSLRAVLETGQGGLVLRKKINEEMLLEGGVKVVEGSKLSYIKGFDAKGSLQFTGKIAEPDLAITAEYNARRLRADQTSLEPYLVRIILGGKPSRPTLDLSYTINGVEPAETNPERKQRNALSLLLFERTENELGGLGGAGAGLISSSIDAGIGTAASQLLSTILAGNLDFIKSVEVDLSGTGLIGGGSDLERARLNVVTQIGQVVARFGGNVRDPGRDGIVTVDLPVSVLTNANFFKDWIIQLASMMNSSTNGLTTINNETRTNLKLRLVYRTTW